MPSKESVDIPAFATTVRANPRLAKAVEGKDAERAAFEVQRITSCSEATAKAVAKHLIG